MTPKQFKLRMEKAMTSGGEFEKFCKAFTLMSEALLQDGYEEGMEYYFERIQETRVKQTQNDQI